MEKKEEVKFVQLYNEDGEKVEALSKEEYEAKVEGFETEKKEMKEKLEKLEVKDFNFKALRDGSKEERDKLLSELSDKDKQIILLQEKTDKKIDDFKDSVVGGYKTDAIREASGGDEELEKKIKLNFARIAGEEDTKEQIIEKVKDAKKMSLDNAIDPVAALSGTMSAGDIKPIDKTDLTPSQKDLGSKLGLSDEEMGKNGK